MHTEFKTKAKTVFKWAALGAALTLAFTWVLLRSPILMPKLNIEVENFPAEKSQLYYKKLTPYSEQNSVFKKIDPSRTRFQFQLPFYDDELRWDPLENAEAFDLKSVSISLLAYRMNISMDDVNPSFQLQKTFRNNLYFFSAPPGSTDPQITIHINSAHLEKVRAYIAFMLAALLSLATIGWIVWHPIIMAYFQKESSWATRLKAVVKNDNFSVIEFSTFLSIGIILNLIPLTNFFLSVDDEVGAFRTDPSVWIADGRWTAFLVEKFIFPLPVLPFVPNLFFYVCLAASYMLILRSHNLTFTKLTALTYCVFVAHPVWWFIAEFYSNLPSTGLGVLCLSISLYIVSRIDLSAGANKTKLLAFACASLLLAAAIGAYQSLVMFYLAIGMGIIIFAAKTNTTPLSNGLRPLFKRIALIAAVFLCGLVLYAFINKIAKHFYPTNPGYLDSFLKLDALLENPLFITKLTVYEMFKIYTGSEQTFGVDFFISAIMLCLATLLLITQKTWKASARMMLFIAALLISPFLLHFVTGGNNLPLRSMLAVSFISWFSVMVVLEYKGRIRVLGLVLSALLVFQIVTINGQYSASTLLATNHDRLTAEEIYKQIAESNPQFDRNARAHIDIFGKLSFNSRYPSPDSSTMSASFFDWDDGNGNRMIKYMQLVGFRNVFPLQPSDRIALTPKFKNMPVWPAPGSVRLDNGVYLIKLSEKPDPTHAQYH
ncbi:glucosyltransferase domain-containing protein [Pseudomonas sp. rhizo66]|uniref:glucosyltransferase domain-containing protein n=1 Tax=Pseudomonas sp. rhizo66 TaxID=3059674 RepID=UPI002891DA8D|nr:glucosyltransferase domain-containing protein [Pseudomonas sp. rhizo66]MDT3313315.1 glucosyltransferase domain-containing protein [Pseudomonas sp. rhizo66]